MYTKIDLVSELAQGANGRIGDQMLNIIRLLFIYEFVL